MSDQFKLRYGLNQELDFDLWDGPPPFYPRGKYNTITKAGVDGAAKQYVGVIPEPFSVNLTKFARDENEMTLLVHTGWRFVVGQACSLTYGGDDITGRTGYLFFVDEADPLSIKAATLIVTPDANYTSGYEIKGKFTLTPVKET